MKQALRVPTGMYLQYMGMHENTGTYREYPETLERCLTGQDRTALARKVILGMYVGGYIFMYNTMRRLLERLGGITPDYSICAGYLGRWHCWVLTMFGRADWHEMMLRFSN